MTQPARTHLTLAFAALALGAAAAVAQGTTRHPMSIDDIMAMKNVGGPAISPNGTLVAFTVSGWEHPGAKSDTAKSDRHDVRGHVWLVPADGAGRPRQLTFSERGESQPLWSPDGTTLAFISARGAAATGGDDASGPRAQIHLLRLAGGEAEQLTSARDGITGYSWSPDGHSIAFLSTDSLSREEESRRKRHDDPQVFEGDERLTHLWVIELATKKAREIAHSAMYTVRGAPTWSPDGARLAFVTSPTTLIRDERRAAYIVALAAGAVSPVQVPFGAVQSTPQWSPDGSTLAFSALAQTHSPHGDGMMEREQRNSHLVLYDVATMRARDAYSEKQFDDSPGALHWSADGKRIYFTAGDRAWSSVWSFDVASASYQKITNHQLIGALSFTRDGTRIACSIQSSLEPSDIYVTDPGFASPQRLSHMNPQLASIALGETEVITWQSTDGQTVEGILLKPVGYRPGQRVPLLVEPHGGPTGASNAGFKASPNSPGQYWAGRGWATLYPNPRGSTNYGEKFMRGNIPDWGGGDYRDIMSGVDAVIARGMADPEKLAVAGWSYGGYMTAWVVGQTTRFKAARMGAGLADLESMYGTTDIPGYIGTFFNGLPAKETLAFYRERSPITYADKVTTPLLIMHGGNDQRVPIGQPMEFYRALKDRGKTVELVFYPREGHGFGEYYHQIDKMRREFDWIDRHTLGMRPAVQP
ncbi:MAG TPA: S9 family peptidase [Gemmatimonadaceae bacterium]|nr:S9 family peptidase [Gemmatimonadaceae bacterium]